MANAIGDKPKEHFLKDLQALPANGDPDWIVRIRALGLDHFQATPYPHTRMEEFRQTNLASISEVPYRSLLDGERAEVSPDAVAPFLYGEGAWTELVFIDGILTEDLSVRPGSVAGLSASSLLDAVHGAEAVHVECHLDKYLRDRNAYTALNSASLQRGAYVRVARNAKIEAPIHLVFVTSDRRADTAAHLRNLVILEEGSEASLVVSYVNLATRERYLNNVVDEIALLPNSELKLYKLVEEGEAGNHLGTTELHQERDSRCTSFCVSMTGKAVRNQLCARLEGEGASVVLTGLYLNDNERLIDNMLHITHVKPRCTSRIAYKGILDGKSKAVFTGKVYVHPEAQKTDSNQLSNNLMLSDAATIDAKPQLEIYADDVKCTHGATIGSPPEPVIFYFRSRGIDEATARAMLTYGFAEEIVSEIEVGPLRERLGGYVYDKYSP